MAWRAAWKASNGFPRRFFRGRQGKTVSRRLGPPHRAAAPTAAYHEPFVDQGLLDLLERHIVHRTARAGCLIEKQTFESLAADRRAVVGNQFKQERFKSNLLFFPGHTGFPYLIQRGCRHHAYREVYP
jgi:hypothetical protein